MADPRECSLLTALSSWRNMLARSELVGCCLLASRRDKHLWVGVEEGVLLRWLRPSDASIRFDLFCSEMTWT